MTKTEVCRLTREAAALLPRLPNGRTHIISNYDEGGDPTGFAIIVTSGDVDLAGLLQRLAANADSHQQGNARSDI